MANVFLYPVLVATVLFLIVVWYIHFHIKRKRLYELSSQFSGPAPLPLIGNALKCLVPLTDITDSILKGSSYYKSPVRLWVGPYLCIFIWDPENIKIVLNSSHALGKQPFMYKLVEAISGRGLVTSPVAEWKRHRKLIAPIFNQALLESFFKILRRQSEKLVDTLRNKENKGEFDVHDYLVAYSLDSILGAMLDFNDEADDSHAAHEMKEWTQIMFSALMTRLTTIWYFSDFIFKMSSIGKQVEKVKEQYSLLIESFIKRWEDYSIKSLKRNQPHIQSSDSTKPKNLIAHFLSISDGSGKFTVDELRGEINTIIAAGLETTSSTMGFALLMLGIYPEIQKKVYEEIVQVLGSRKQLEFEDLKDLEYLERVIKETLRLFPPAGGLARYTDQEIQLKNHTIPASTTVVIGLLNLHRDPNIWPNPNRFDPGRFLPAEEEKRQPYSWIPFSAGPRNCIGIRFGMTSLKIALANIILKYKVSTEYKSVEDIHLTMILVFKPTNGFKLSITSRE